MKFRNLPTCFNSRSIEKSQPASDKSSRGPKDSICRTDSNGVCSSIDCCTALGTVLALLLTPGKAELDTTEEKVGLFPFHLWLAYQCCTIYACSLVKDGVKTLLSVETKNLSEHWQHGDLPFSS